MKKIWTNYKEVTILVISIIIGAIAGLIFKEKINIIKPLGDIFINMIFVIIIPLIFFTTTSAFIKMENPKRLGKIIINILIVFIISSIIVALIALAGSYSSKLVDMKDTANIGSLLDQESVIDTELSLLERTASLLTVNDLTELLSRNNIMAVLVFSIIVGIAIRMTKEKGEPVKKLIISFNDVILNVVKIITYYAPIGLGCYMAVLTGTYGESIALGFLKTFIIYTIVCILVYVFIYSIYALYAGGKKALIIYWKNIFKPSVTALATCSSAACIPSNIEAIKNIGVSDDIAEVLVPIGTNFHKEGSVIGSVFKIVFLAHLFDLTPSIWLIIGTSLIATLLVSAIPIGGGTISEMMILSLMGYPAAALPILTIIATVIDAPATVLNVTGDTASALIVAKNVDGKKWMKRKATT